MSRTRFYVQRKGEAELRMMDVYDKSVCDVQRYLQWPEINFRDEHSLSFSFFQEHEDKYEMTKAKI